MGGRYIRKKNRIGLIKISLGRKHFLFPYLQFVVLLHYLLQNLCLGNRYCVLRQNHCGQQANNCQEFVDFHCSNFICCKYTSQNSCKSVTNVTEEITRFLCFLQG